MTPVEASSTRCTPSVADRRIGKNFAIPSVRCVNWKFEPIAGAEKIPEKQRR